MTNVQFRKDEQGDIFAFFPDMDFNAWTSDLKTSYAHIGQHSACHTDYVKDRTTEANEAEYSDLMAELISIGYNDLVI